jgi:multidrug transporter EmrE-like cation transporter
LRWRNQEEPMSGLKIVAIVLIIAGALALAYGSFSFTRETHQTKIGPIELSVKEKETVNIPVWAGLGAVLIGVVLLVVGKGK